MPRLISAFAAALVLAGCGSSSESEPSEKAPSQEEDAKPTEEPSLCRADDVAALAKMLAGADAKARRDGVANLKEACDLPEGSATFFEATRSTDVSDETKAKAARAEAALAGSVCTGNEDALAEIGKLAPAQRTPKVFDTCGLGRFGLTDRDAWLRTNPTTVMPFVTMAWLEAQGVAKDDAKTIASAMLLRARRTWGFETQQVPIVGGMLAAVPADAIEVAVTPEAVYVEGAKVLELEAGKLPETFKGEKPKEPFGRALKAEQEAKGEGEVTFAMVADARVRAETLIRLGELAEGQRLGDVGWVVQSEPLAYGMLSFAIRGFGSSSFPKLSIDDGGFTLTPPGGGTAEHVGPENAEHSYDFEALATKAKEYWADHRGEARGVLLDVSDETPASVLLTAIHRLHGEDCETDESKCWFTDVSVAKDIDSKLMDRNVGVLGLLSAEGGYIGSPYGSAFDVDPDEHVWGGLVGTEVDEAFGAGGLGLVGSGRGGGGTGEGSIGLGDVGMIGKGGSSGGAGFGGRGKKLAKVHQSKATVKGSLDKDIIRRIVRAHINEVRYCYEAGLKKDPKLEGRLVIGFTIGTDGKVSKAEVDSTTVDDETVGTCVAKKVKRWKFPKPAGGGLVLVSYPFELSPG